MDRRELMMLLGAAAVCSPRVAVAQTPSRVYRLAVINPGGLLGENNMYVKLVVPALAQRG